MCFMEALLSFLPMLICPILMGLMVWMMNRQELQNAAELRPQKSLWHELKHLALCCINPYVVGGLALVRAGLYWVSPETLWRFAPTLVILICPLSMSLTLFNLNRRNHLSRPPHPPIKHQENRKLL